MTPILIAGCGYIGTALGLHLARLGHRVWGLRRETSDLPSPLRPLTADLTNPETLQALPAKIDTVFYTVSPDHSDEAGYRAAYIDGLQNLLDILKPQEQQPRIFYTSSTAVYAQQFGEWVDESSPTTPEYFSGRCLLEGEQYLLHSGFPATVVRLGGIYGPGRTRLIQKVREGNAIYQNGPPRYTNHIHRDDCVGALTHLMMLEKPDSLYLGVDNEASERRELLYWLAKELDAPQPRCDVSPSRERRQVRNNKRCKNTKLINSGYQFRYSTYREGYGELVREMMLQ